MLVTTDGDYWNSADEARFVIANGQVKLLPEFRTPIIEDALKQGMLREATIEEIQKQEFSDAVNNAVKSRKIIAGFNYEGTVKNYQKYIESIKEEEKEEIKTVLKEEPKEEIKEEPKEEPKEEIEIKKSTEKEIEQAKIVDDEKPLEEK